MTTVGKIYDALNEFCNFENSEPWDNSGLLVGDRKNLVNKILVSLDITLDTVEKAREMGAQLIVSHHPVIFRPLKNLSSDNPVYQLVKNDISAICAHTCLDAAKGGVNDVLAEILELSGTHAVKSDETSTLLLRVGETKREYTPEEFARFVGEKLKTKVLFANGKNNIRRVMLCTGSGGEFFKDAKALGCDALVTGEAGYHHMLDASFMGITLIAAGHFETENPVIFKLKDYLQRRFNNIEIVALDAKRPIEIL